MDTKLGSTKFAPLYGFDEDFYLFRNPDVAVSGEDAAQHFLTIGWIEGRDPSAHFSVRGYLKANPDVAESGSNPLIHFLEFGLKEGRIGWQT